MTLDTGFLIALERRKRPAWVRWRLWLERRERLTVPAPVVAEWWRTRARTQREILAGVTVEPLTEDLAKIAGEALSTVKVQSVDAIVMASAAQRGDIVHTGDVTDLERLRLVFPGVRVLGVG